MATGFIVNGEYYSFARLEFNLNGTIIVAVKEINYDDNLEPGEARGSHPQALGTTAGEYKATGDCTLLRPAFDQLISQLGQGFGMTPIDATCTYYAPGQPMVTDTLYGCRITKVGSGNTQGTDASAIKLDLRPSLIKWNGITLLDSPME